MRSFTKNRLKELLFFISIVFLLQIVVSNANAAGIRRNWVDSIPPRQKAREVFTSQQLFVVKLCPVKGKRHVVKYAAELRDAFKVILYDKDTSFTEINWVICPDGKCPAVGIYSFGTPGYQELDSWIANSKKPLEKLKGKTKNVKK